jgi:hypothetical protein
MMDNEVGVHLRVAEDRFKETRMHSVAMDETYLLLQIRGAAFLHIARNMGRHKN